MPGTVSSVPSTPPLLVVTVVAVETEVVATGDCCWLAPTEGGGMGLCGGTHCGVPGVAGCRSGGTDPGCSDDPSNGVGGWLLIGPPVAAGELTWWLRMGFVSTADGGWGGGGTRGLSWPRLSCMCARLLRKSGVLLGGKLGLGPWLNTSPGPCWLGWLYGLRPPAIEKRFHGYASLENSKHQADPIELVF